MGRLLHFVMAGLVPAIHVFPGDRVKDVGGRHKAGHDAVGAVAVNFVLNALD